MKKFIFLLFILLFIPKPLFSATLIFETGFELGVELDAPDATHQHFKDCGGGHYGCLETGKYYVPEDFPGYCATHSCTEHATSENNYLDHYAYFNFTNTGNDEAQITEGSAINGSYGLRIYNDNAGAPQSRVQLNLTGDSGAALSSGNNFKRTLIKVFVNFPQLPNVNNTFLLWQEHTGQGNPGRVMWNKLSDGTEYISWFGGSTATVSWPCGESDSCGNGTQWGYRTEISYSDYENKDLEVIYFAEYSATGHVILKIKPAGESAVTLINWSGDNAVGWLEGYESIKAYGTKSDQWVSWDDLKWYSSTGYTDLPDWDTDAVAPTPDPATWLVEPVGASTTTMTMTATTGMDVETPILYQFVVDPAADSCAAVLGGADYGTDGTTGTWQASPTYVDEGLQLNRGYCYNVQMKDDLGNAGTAGTTLHGHTWAATPGASTLGGATDTTLDITEVDENLNTAGTWIAIQVTSSVPYDADWDQKWVNDADGTPEAAEQWIGFETWDADVTVVDLNLGTEYCFKAKAINAFNVQTALGPEVCLSTTGSPVTPPDVSAIGVGAVGVKFD